MAGRPVANRTRLPQTTRARVASSASNTVFHRASDLSLSSLKATLPLMDDEALASDPPSALRALANELEHHQNPNSALAA